MLQDKFKIRCSVEREPLQKQSKGLYGLHWLPIILKKQYKILQIFFQKNGL